ncbi:MAG TPA: protein-glutamine glutaminase family protein [Chitinophagales bacterium]|nr:protein-glutamine glutaminase family protein [Chitinophagales bacterium]
MKSMYKLLLMSTCIVILASCSQQETLLPDEQFISQETPYRLMTPAYYKTMDDGSIQVRFFESPRIYDVSKGNTQFTEIKQLMDDAIAQKQPLRITESDGVLPYIILEDAEPASKEEMEQYMTKYDETVDPIATKKALPTLAALNTIFDYCAAQGCATGTATIDYCIPFQYVVDGCYARAHKMRQIMLNDYDLSCEKVFSYEGPGPGSLAVDAGDCCVYWWYHVAPLVSVKAPGGGFTKYVVDPSMFDEPVSIETWTSAQENFSCTPNANWGYYEITPGKIYTPGGGTDNSYSSTNWTLQAYANLETCD